MQKDKTKDKLLGLLAQGKKYTQGELAKELGVRQSAISKQLKRMEKRGWVMGHGATSNRYFELTKSGISAAQNPSQNGISRASKSENGISYTGNVFLVINAQPFKELIEGVVNLKDNGKDKKALIKVDMNGIEIKQLESSGIAMIVARIPKARFISYRIGNPEELGVDLERISRLIDGMPNDKELTATVLEKDGKRKLKMECGGHVGSVLIENVTRHAEKEPTVVFKSAAEIDGKLLQKSVHELIKVGKRGHTTFQITKENLTLTTTGRDEEESSRIFDRTEVKLKTDAQEQTSTYNTEFIESMLTVLKKDTPVTIQLTTKEPIKISYHMDGVDFAYYMAPYIEDERNEA